MSTKALSRITDGIASGETSFHFHLMGVGGSGMCGLASMLLAAGHKVSGSDLKPSNVSRDLEEEGLVFTHPQLADEAAGADAVVYSSAVKAGNPAYDTAVAAGIPMIHRAECLAALLNGKRGIVVAGTHGKTTTTGMLAYLLRGAGRDPSFYVGASVPSLGRSAAPGSGELFVAEGDESDGTLVNYRPEISILLNVEADHLDHYGAGEEGILGLHKVFTALVQQTSKTVVYCADDAGASIFGELHGNTISYGLTAKAKVHAEDTKLLPGSSEFNVVANGEVLGKVTLGLAGSHNVQNALGAIATALHLGVGFPQIVGSLASYSGASRRFETKLRTAHYRVIDDYGHHPTEVKATLAAAAGIGGERLLCVFQPHRYSRTKALMADFATAFGDADHVWIAPVYAASEEPIDGATSDSLANAISDAGHQSALAVDSLDAATAAVGNAARPGDVILILGAGNVGTVAPVLAHDLGQLSHLTDALGGEPAKLRLYEPMAQHTTLRVGGRARLWLRTESELGFQRALKFLHEETVPVRVIGRGSNLLIRDGGISGAVIQPAKGEFDEVVQNPDGTFTAGAGVRFKKLASAAASAGIGGFEWMEGIPGNVGGSLRMNAGAMGIETFDQVVSMRTITPAGEIHERQRHEIEAHYRSVPELVTNYAISATFKGEPDSAESIQRKLDESKRKRKTGQPIAASAGCIFKNPTPEIPAGKLVDELGLKGLRIGKAEVSEVHANFITNTGKAPASDVLALIKEIRARAKKERNLELQTEVEILGQDSSYLGL